MCQYALTSAASTSTLTAWPIRSTASTSRACEPLRTSRPTTPFNGPPVDLHHHALVNQRAGIVLQIALDQPADAFDLVRRNRRDFAVERDDVDDARAAQDRQPLIGIEAREAVAGKERPVDLLLPILPAAPAGDGGQEGLDAFLRDLIAHHLFVPRTRPDRVPRRRRVWLSQGCCLREPRLAARTPCAARRSSTR